MIVIGCDPGPTKSAVVIFDGAKVVSVLFDGNQAIEEWLADAPKALGPAPLVIEKIESFGMAVGAEVFETVFHSGRFARAYWPRRVERLSRREVKHHLCHTVRATDANIRQAILDRFGGSDNAIGKKKEPGPLYEVKGHLWAALAVAVTWFDKHGSDNPIRPGVQAEW